MDRYLITREFWLPDLGLKPVMTRRSFLDKTIALDAAFGAEPQARIGPQVFVMKIGDGAARSVPGEPGYAAVWIYDVAVIIGSGAVQFFEERNSVRSGAGMSMTDRPS